MIKALIPNADKQLLEFDKGKHGGLVNCCVAGAAEPGPTGLNIGPGQKHKKELPYTHILKYIPMAGPHLCFMYHDLDSLIKSTI